jgi:peptide/nickel transport system permease protein
MMKEKVIDRMETGSAQVYAGNQFMMKGKGSDRKEPPSEYAIKKRSRFMEIFRQLKKNKMAWVGVAILLLFILSAVFADVLFDYDSVVIKRNIQARMQPPSGDHWFGTDELGRDILSRLVHGTRISLMVGFIAVTISLAIGAPLGAIAGFYEKRFSGLSAVIMRFTDILDALPSILLAITIVTALGQTMFNMLLAVAIASVPGYVRIIRSSVLKIKSEEYIEAARAIGLRDWEIILYHVLPNCVGPILVHATMKVASTILSIAGLCFLGLGIKPPTPEWGLMLSAGRSYLRDAWWMTFFPGFCIMLVVMGFNLVGDGLRDAMDPKMKK